MKSTNLPLTFEVRIPAYDRPTLLRRAIESLQKQSYPHWKAVVFDDSSSFDSQDVVEAIADTRITYVRNSHKMGAAGNIDQCFSPLSTLGGHFGCLLEDDNFWLANFLSTVYDKAAKHGCELILANQRIADEGAGLRPPIETTRGDWFSEGMIDPLLLRATLFFMEGLSNGGLVWKLGDEINLQVGPKIRATGLQEACRTLLVKKPFVFIEKSEAVYTLMPKSKTARATEHNRMIGRGMQSIRDFILKANGLAVVEVAKSLAVRLGLTRRLVESCAYSGRPFLAGDLLKGYANVACRSLAKGMAIRIVEKDPCAEFLAQGRLSSSGP